MLSLRLKYQLRTSAATMVTWLMMVGTNSAQSVAVNQLPANGLVTRGSATINNSGATTTINQSSDKAIINWHDFSVGADSTVNFNQLSKNSTVLNRVTGNNTSQIFGNLNADGTVFLVNQNGILFGKDAVVNVGGLVASTAYISDDNFWSGNYIFDYHDSNTAFIRNDGLITIKEKGLAAFVAPYVVNNGIINARLGRVAVGATNSTFSIDFYGDNLIKFAMSNDKAIELGLKDSDNTGVDISGKIIAEGGSIAITADLAREIVTDVITVNGELRANSISENGGKIILSGGHQGNVKINETAIVNASGVTGGEIIISGEKLFLDAALDASGDPKQYAEALGYLYANNVAQPVIDEVLSWSRGGSINATGSWISLGGNLNTNGSNGGVINITAEGFFNSGSISSTGYWGNGGSVNIGIDKTILEFDMANINASGFIDGGDINVIAGQQITSSGDYKSDGLHGSGGYIDLTANAIKSLSGQYFARGGRFGGQIRIGGEFQGGKNLFTDQLKNANTNVFSTGSLIDISGGSKGGTAIIWSDQETVFLGSIRGDDAFVEISSSGTLNYKGDVQIGGGKLLLDPKNINILDDVSAPPSLALIMGYNYAGNPGQMTDLANSDKIGSAVSLDGNLLAIGAFQDDGFANDKADVGAVYLFKFSDTSLNNPSLSAIIGSGYTGGNNIDNTAIEAGDHFGVSISLEGSHLAIGANADSGLGNTVAGGGAAYLYSFTGDFTNITENAIIGADYTGGNNVDNTGLGAGDLFGSSVALSGNYLAIGATQDDGPSDATVNTGAAYLYSFTGDFTSITEEAIVGADYVGGNNTDNTALEADDNFGAAVSIDASLLAIGASGDDGATDTVTDAGAAYLYNFTGDFTNVTQNAIIGADYAGGNNIDNTTLGGSDNFASALTINGTNLLIGAPNDDGFSDSGTDLGAAYLYDFTGNFTNLTQRSIVGKGYSGGNNLDVTSLEDNDNFATSVSLNGSNIAIGTTGDDGDLNSGTDHGSVHLIGWTGGGFTPTYKGIIGQGYDNSPSSSFGFGQYNLENSDFFGAAVALDSTHLAIGAYGDDGFGNGVSGAGAVYLYTFAGVELTTPSLSAIIGADYTGGNNIDNTNLGINDEFGHSVALDGNHLAVGALGDDDLVNGGTDKGAVYLYSFTGDFTSITEEAIVGAGYVGGNNLNIASVGNEDKFGRSVALDGSHLAVGASGDDGGGTFLKDTGAVYLFSYTGDFTNITQEAVIGREYTGGNNFAISLDQSDQFGTSVSLDGGHIAIGAPLDDDGNTNATTSAGAVHLFSYTGNFTNITKDATIGKGYSGGKNLDNTTLEAFDVFGNSVSIDGDHLAIGATGDDNFTNTGITIGAVYLYSFSGNFVGLSEQSILGEGYVGGGNLDTFYIDTSDNFGSSVSLDGQRLAVGAFTNNGFANGSADSGSVYLFNAFDPTPSDVGWNFADNTSNDSTIYNSDLTALLNAGTDVTLQASNDITLSTNILVNNAGGNGGVLDLQAGRSVFINGDLTTDNGNLSITANDTAANGVVDADRDAGAAAITMSGGTTIDVGTGSATFTLSTGAGNTNSTSGDLSLAIINGANINIENWGANNGSILTTGIMTASNTGDAIILRTNGSYINTGGASALNATNGRFVVFVNDTSDVTAGGLSALNWYNTATNASVATVTSTGNRWVSNEAATLTVTADNQVRTYGAANPTFGQTITGYINGETNSILLGTVGNGNSTATGTTDVGAVAINASIGSLSTDFNYSINTAGGILTINSAALNVTADNQTKTYGANLNLGMSGFTSIGLQNGETIGNVNLTSTGGYDSNTSANVGNYANDIIASGASGGTFSATNYTIAYNGGDLGIDPASLLVTADNQTKTYGANLNLGMSGFTSIGLQNGETIGSVALTSMNNYDSSTTVKGGVYENELLVSDASGGTFNISNYKITYVEGDLTVDEPKGNDDPRWDIHHPVEIISQNSGGVEPVALPELTSNLNSLTPNDGAEITSFIGSYLITTDESLISITVLEINAENILKSEIPSLTNSFNIEDGNNQLIQFTFSWVENTIFVQSDDPKAKHFFETDTEAVIQMAIVELENQGTVNVGKIKKVYFSF